jgi:hypothetical protein
VPILLHSSADAYASWASRDFGQECLGPLKPRGFECSVRNINARRLETAAIASGTMIGNYSLTVLVCVGGKFAADAERLSIQNAFSSYSTGFVFIVKMPMKLVRYAPMPALSETAAVSSINRAG